MESSADARLLSSVTEHIPSEFSFTRFAPESQIPPFSTQDFLKTH